MVVKIFWVFMVFRTSCLRLVAAKVVSVEVQLLLKINVVGTTIARTPTSRIYKFDGWLGS